MYRWNPNDYHHNSEAQKKLAHEILDRLDLDPASRVLDIGCGDGKITAEIARRVPDGFVLGVDGSPDMVAFARERFARDPSVRLDFDERDARDFARRPLANEDAFDFAFSNACLHWVAEQPQVLRSLHNALRPGGRFYFQMGGRGNVAELKAAVDSVTVQDAFRDYFADFPGPYHFHGPEEYGGWLAAAGLKADRLELIQRDTYHPGEDGVATYLRTTWMPYTSRVPEELRDEFIREAARLYVATYPPAADGTVRIPMMRLEVVGYKN